MIGHNCRCQVCGEDVVRVDEFKECSAALAQALQTIDRLTAEIDEVTGSHSPSGHLVSAARAAVDALEAVRRGVAAHTPDVALLLVQNNLLVALHDCGEALDVHLTDDEARVVLQEDGLSEAQIRDVLGLPPLEDP